MPTVNNKYKLDTGDYGDGYDRLENSLESKRLEEFYNVRKHWVVKMKFLTRSEF